MHFQSTDYDKRKCESILIAVNNVDIFAGTKVLDGATIGDDVIMSANAEIVKDIPLHSEVVMLSTKVYKSKFQLIINVKV